MFDLKYADVIGPSIDSLPLPENIIRALKERGIEKLTPPQEGAVKKGLFDGRNIIVSSPTASGKTLIAELGLINAWLNRKKGLYATPLKTLASEKATEFSHWESIGLKVGLTTGDYDEPGEWLGRYDIIVATYERLDSIFRLKPSWLKNVGTIVIDEFHMIGEPERGPIVELLAVRSMKLGMQLIGLSATIGNPEELAEWVDAELVLSDWRPVKLIEGYYSRKKNAILFKDGRVEPVKGRLVHHVARETFKNGYQTIIFVQARHRAETLAKSLSKLFGSSSLITAEVLKELKSSEAPKIEKENLTPLIGKGVAYHHAGLSLSARRVIEEGFRRGALRLIVATPTLAAGINLPARRVLIYTKRYESGYMKPIPVFEYKQMAGRAGRPQYDPYGEAVIADAPNDDYAMRYIYSSAEDVKSSLINERAMRVHTLALISSGDAKSVKELMEIMELTLAYMQLGPDTGENAVEYVLNRLIGMGMVNISGTKLSPTKLGSYVSRLYIDPLTAIMVLENLETVTEVPPLYYFTLIAMTPDFTKARIVKYKALEDEANAALDNGMIPEPLMGIDYYEWLRAFKIGKILNAWIQEVPEDRILEKYDIGAGDLRNIVETAEWLLYASSRVCEAKGLESHSSKLRVLTTRVKHGIMEDLLDLVRVKGIGRVRARVLYSVGIRRVEELAAADPTRIAALPGFGRKIAESVINEAKNLVLRSRRVINCF